MAEIEYPLVNGNRHGFSSVGIVLNGMKFRGFKGVNYGRVRSREKLWGNHPDPFAKTQGENDYNCDVELYTAEFLAFLELLGDGYGDIYFDTTVSYGPHGFDTKTDLITGCTLDTTEVTAAQGSSALTRKFQLNPLKIKLSGKDDLKTSLGPP